MAKKSLREIKKMQSVEAAPVAKTTIEKTSITKNSTPKTETVGLDQGKRKSPRINITISRHTYEALKAAIDEQQDRGINASMSGFIDDLIREKLELD